MTFVTAALISGGAMLGSALLGSSASRSAGKAQAAAADRAAELSQEQYFQTREDQTPWREAGVNALARQRQLMGLGEDQGTGGFGRYAQDFGMQDYQEDPGYRFRLSEGMKALGNQASARGGMISGQTMKGMQDYAQGSASQEFNNAFNRYQTNRSNQLNPLQSLSGGGQTATNLMGAAGQNYANQAGEAYMGAGHARASAYMGQANAISGAVGGYMNYRQQEEQNSMNRNLMNRIWPQGGGNIGGGGGSVGGGSPYGNVPTYGPYT